MRILVVEDQDSIRSMICALMRARGYEVEAVRNGSKALQSIEQAPPDVVLLDLMMPGQYDGIEVCERLRANPKTSDLPVVIISAAAEESARARAQEAGATAYYTKPFSPRALLEEVGRLQTANSAEAAT